MKMKFTVNEFILCVLGVVIGVSVDLSLCYPVSYKEPPKQGGQPQQPRPMTTTPKTIKDNFKINKQVLSPARNETEKKPLQLFIDNDTGDITPSADEKDNGLGARNKPFEEEIDSGLEAVTFNVKAVNLAEKALKQSNGGDDDDDDGGEYDGMAEHGGVARKKDNLLKLKQNAVPMMIIREVDVMAMDIPVNNHKDKNGCCPQKEPIEHNCQHNDFDIASHKEPIEIQTEPPVMEIHEASNCPNDGGTPVGDYGQTHKTHKHEEADWGEWSPCSKSCGDGIQKRSRVRPTGVREKDTQTRVCHVADCPASDYQVKYRHF